MKIAGSIGIRSVRWYGKEGEHEVIVMEHLETSLGDLVTEQELDRRKTFEYALQMVCSSCALKGLIETYVHAQAALCARVAT
jgi:hypothetical protein